MKVPAFHPLSALLGAAFAFLLFIHLLREGKRVTPPLKSLTCILGIYGLYEGIVIPLAFSFQGSLGDKAIGDAVNGAYLIFASLLAAMIAYVMQSIPPSARLHRSRNFFRGLFLVYFGCVFLNFLFPILFSWSQESGVRLNALLFFPVVFGIPIFTCTLVMAIGIRHRRVYSRLQMVTFCFAFPLILLGFLMEGLVVPSFPFACVLGTLGVYILYFFIDAPDYMVLKSFLRKAREKEGAEDLRRKKNEVHFASSTHELRTPLNAVLGLDEIILSDDRSVPVHRAALELHQNIEDLLHVINEILSQARQMSGEGQEKNVSQGQTDLPVPGETGTMPAVLAGKRALCVDDTAINRKVLLNMLRGAGMLVTTAEGGQEALELVRTESFDVILLDHRMPGMDGVETFRRMKEEKVRTPVIMVSGSEEGDFFREEGFQGFLLKPVRRGGLLSLLEGVLSGKSGWEGEP